MPMHPRQWGDGIRKPLHDWLLSWTTVHALFDLVVAIACIVLYESLLNSSDFEFAVYRFFLIILSMYFLSGPIGYFGVPVLGALLCWIILPFMKDQPAFPCPICGYDIRVTPHRCPECGTKLQWGQLPDAR